MAGGSAGAGWSVYHGTYQEQLDAERRLAELRGDEYAIEVDLWWAWDMGAPLLPHLLANERRVYLVCYLREPVPGWDGTWVQVVDPAAEHAVPLGVVEFKGVHSVKFGGASGGQLPVDHAGGADQLGSPDAPRRLAGVTQPLPVLLPRLDLECLAGDLTGQQRTASLRDLPHELANRLLD